VNYEYPKDEYHRLLSRYFDYTVNDWEATKDSVPTPYVSSASMTLLPIICSNLFTLAKVHEQAQRHAWNRGIVMMDYDVIMKVGNTHRTTLSVTSTGSTRRLLLPII
jgi:hypothetical protein